MINYLTRYVTGGPISNRRIVSGDSRSVTFLAREGARVGGERTQVPIAISTAEFTDRWCNHIQPTGLTKVRYFGGWSGNKAAAYKTLCEDLLPSTTDRLLASVLDEANQPHKPDIVCEHCGSDRLVLVEHTAKPSWRDPLGYSSAHVPWWYKEARNEDDQRFWDGAMGAGFNDWYLETLIESAKEPEPTQTSLAHGFRDDSHGPRVSIKLILS